MITVYNFLADSIKYNRPNDIGVMIARIFVNRDRHFFVDGEKPLSFLYSELDKAVLDEAHVKSIIESCILFALDFDLFAPQYDQVRAMTVQEKLQLTSAVMRTGKPLGFHVNHENKK